MMRLSSRSIWHILTCVFIDCANYLCHFVISEGRADWQAQLFPMNPLSYRQ